MVTWVSLVVIGVLFTWWGSHGLRHKTYIDGLPAIEAAILKQVGEEPLPKTKWDRIQGHIQCWLMVIFGILAVGLGTVGLVVE